MSAGRPLLVGLGWLDRPGGLERYLAELRSHLDDPPTIVLGPASDPPAGVVVAASQDDGIVRRLRAVRRAAGRSVGGSPPVDVVDLHFALTGVAARTHRAVRRLPHVVHFQGPWAEESGGGRWRAWIERAALRGAERVVVLSGAMGRTVVEDRGVTPWRVTIIPPGSVVVPTDATARAAARERLGVAPDAFLAVAVRRLVPRTGIDVLVDAWAGVATELPRDAHLLVAGDGPERASLDARIRHRPGAGAVRLLGRVDDATVADLHAAADVAVIPSRALEGYGLAALEALAWGTPVIASTVGGLPEALAGTGCPLVPPGDPEALGRALLDVVRRPRDRARCRARAEEADWESVADRHRSLYAAAARRAGVPGPRVVVVDHAAGDSGGEIAMARLCTAITDAHQVCLHAVLFEPGPFATRLALAGVTHEVRALGVAGTVDRRHVLRPLPLLRHGARVAWHTATLTVRLGRLRPDVVHANSLKAGLIAGVAARVTRTPMIWHVRDRLTADYLGARSARLARWAVARLATAVVVPSETVAATLRRRPGQEVVVLRDPYAPPLVPDRSPTATVRVAMVGRLAPWKGQTVFIRAWAIAQQRLAARGDGAPTAAAQIVGDALFAVDRTYADSLPALVHDLGLEGSLELTGWDPDVEHLLAAADIAVHASTVPEPHGQVIVEAMAAGAAVIATAAGGPAELIDAGVDGLLVPADDPGALADALVALILDADERRRMGDAAAERIRRTADPTAAATTIVDLYERVAAGRR